MEDNRLYWEGSKTLYEACKYLSTKGFIAAELFESEYRKKEQLETDLARVTAERREQMGIAFCWVHRADPLASCAVLP